ncbi:MAG: toxin-antitoxin system, antitoxin component, Xre family protein [Peptoniphilaceae bacterium]|nr:toxin-antitoxin system, antitoxin component, Xre family protein [Peptoniphilaceae bacterium]MDY3075661.1 toxin-antitoxin system, antitoxin component, Xre family protein [Peptoniphilaceae bacterium]
MTDVKALKQKIQQSGYRTRFLADSLGLSAQGFYNKVNGKTGFYSNEILILSKLLDLSLKERENIFFNTKVDHSSTKIELH